MIGPALLGLAAPATPAPEGPMWVFVGTYTGRQEQRHLPARARPGDRQAAGRRSRASRGVRRSWRSIRAHDSSTPSTKVGQLGQSQPAVSRLPSTRRAARWRSSTASSTVAAALPHERRPRPARPPSWPTTAAASWRSSPSARRPARADQRLSSSTRLQRLDKARQGSRTPTRSTSTRPIASPFASDLGLDKLFVYSSTRTGRRSRRTTRPFAILVPAPGRAPRVPPRRQARLRHRRAGHHHPPPSTTTPIAGVLTLREELRTLPKGYTGTSYTAEVQVHPSGPSVRP